MKTTLTIDNDVAAALGQDRKTREQAIRELASWLSHEEAKELRVAVDIFNKIHEGDPE